MAETAANKIVRLEVQMSNIENKVDTGFAEIKAVIHELSMKVDIISDLKSEIASLREAHATHVQETQAEISELKSRNGFRSWLYPTLSALASAVLTVLVLSYLGRIKG